MAGRKGPLCFKSSYFWEIVLAYTPLGKKEREQINDKNVA